MRKPKRDVIAARANRKIDVKASAGPGIGEAWLVERLGFLGLGSVSAFSAKLFGASATDRNRLSKVFRGSRRLSVEDVKALAEALNVSTAEVLFEFGVGALSPVATVTGQVDALGVVSSTPADQVPAPADAHAGVRVWAALRLAGGLFGGGLAYYDDRPRMLGGLSALAGRVAYVREETGARLLCRVLGADGEEKLQIELMDGTRKRTTRVVFASPVLWVKV